MPTTNIIISHGLGGIIGALIPFTLVYLFPDVILTNLGRVLGIVFDIFKKA